MFVGDALMIGYEMARKMFRLSLYFKFKHIATLTLKNFKDNMFLHVHLPVT